MLNEYSSTWFALFSQGVDPAQTEKEVAFVSRHLPCDRFARILDLCCGEGRHATTLSQRGYRVIGIDRTHAALQAAKRIASCDAQLVQMDARDVACLGSSFDGIICMWQSFGFFEADENEQMLASLGRIVRVGGRLVLDVYNAEFFAGHLGTRCFNRKGRAITEQKSLSDGRLRVELNYGDHQPDIFQWQIYTPDQLAGTLESAGWTVVATCREFDESLAPSAQQARMQFVAEVAA